MGEAFPRLPAGASPHSGSAERLWYWMAGGYCHGTSDPHSRARAGGGESCEESEFRRWGTGSESGVQGEWLPRPPSACLGYFHFVSLPGPQAWEQVPCPHSDFGHQPQGGPSDESFHEVRLLNNISLYSTISQQSA